MIKVIDLTKSFGTQVIFDSISFTMLKGEKAGLVGRNGHGKTTLLRMICGLEHQDSGEILLPRQYTVGYTAQEMHFSEKTLLEEGITGLPDHMKHDTWMVEKLLSGLGFNAEDMERNPEEFSDGYKSRINLGKVLLGAPDLLLLDEPTNFLDIVSIRWLSDFLRKWKGEIILVTHDRSFMDSVTTHTIGIHRKKIRKIHGNTEKLYCQILKEEEIHEKTRINDEKKRKETELFITRFRAKARLAGLVQSRIKALQKMKNLDRLEKIKTMDFSFTCKPVQAKTLMTSSGLAFTWPGSGHPLIRNLSFTVARNDRIAVIGKNGRGKTTLLRLLSGEILPTGGDVQTHAQAEIGFFDQIKIRGLNDNVTVEDEIMSASGDRQRARDIAGAMMFEGDDALKRIRIISGGEKSRVLLGKILAKKSNLLMLDEPTNHLDMESCDALMAAIDEFDGAVIFVTHNELFLHSLANRFIVFQGGGQHVFEGTYQDFLNRVGWEDEKDARPSAAVSATNRKELRKKRAGIQQRRSSLLRPLELRMKEIEDSISTGEKKHSDLTREMISASGSGQSSRIQSLSKEIHSLNAQMESLYDELDQCTIEYERMLIEFDREIREIDTV